MADCQGPEDILGESGLLKQLSVRLVERALAGELSHNLGQDETGSEADSERRNSRNGYSKKTVQSTQGDLDLSIPRDRNGDFEPILVPKHQRRLAGARREDSGALCPWQQHPRHQCSTGRTLWGQCLVLAD